MFDILKIMMFYDLNWSSEEASNGHNFTISDIMECIFSSVIKNEDSDSCSVTSWTNDVFHEFPYREIMSISMRVFCNASTQTDVSFILLTNTYSQMGFPFSLRLYPIYLVRSWFHIFFKRSICQGTTPTSSAMLKWTFWPMSDNVTCMTYLYQTHFLKAWF